MSHDIVRRVSRDLFRNLMKDEATLPLINRAFQGVGFAEPDPAASHEELGQRRGLTQAYLDAVDWTDERQVGRALRAFEWLLHGLSGPAVDNFFASLRRDGYLVDPSTGRITSAGPRFPAGSLANLKDPSAIREHLDRIQHAVVDDPALAIGSAKELIESTAKVALTERGLPVSDRDDVPKLADQAQRALNLHPSASTPGPDGTDPVKKILGAVTNIPVGLAELRNRSGTGHGPAATRAGLRPRHAHLAVNAALTWCHLVLDTLADPDAPWHKNP
ncbi:abortive infection family protein [Frankia sp. ACN1ag]|uniref:abortive infection family protein n=1 Tax=Frankia sp. ACN1ag TaxID=102891 RepID=UPI0006DD181D|nr:abortive infection family protein [Frankia sp. ACN1ag]KQC34754.1 hypothetical protein UK82_30260 [Frankia sp. ACN1ag]